MQTLFNLIGFKNLTCKLMVIPAVRVDLLDSRKEMKIKNYRKCVLFFILITLY